MEFKPDKIDQVMAEADDLIRQIYAQKIEGLGEEQRAEYEQKVRRLEELKAIVKEKFGGQQVSARSSVSGGIHEAIDELVKAVAETAKTLT
jgi:hypothetical protein